MTAAATTTPALAAPADVLRLLESAHVVALDCETCGPEGRGMDGALDPRRGRVRLLSVSAGRRALVLDAFAHDLRQVLPALAGKVLVAHNAAFDLGFLWQAGMHNLPETVCTYLIAQLLTAGEGEHGFTSCSLASCVHRHLQRHLPKEMQASDWSGPLSAEQVEYARRDAEVLPPLLTMMSDAVNKDGLQRAAAVELRCLPAWVWMTQSGVPFDRPAWEALARQAATRKAALGEQLDRLAPQKGQDGLFGPVEHWNWDSPQQVQEVLALLGFPVTTTADAQLALLEHPFADALREHRHASQLVKMYGANWLANASIIDGRLYPGWRQIGTVTGRTSGESPNCQQIPRDEVDGRKVYRCPFAAPHGRLLVRADYATLQMRIACRLAKDVALLKVFQGDGDPHTATARGLLGKEVVTKADRQIAKSANFGLL